METLSGPNELIELWKKRAALASKAHYKTAVKLDRNHRIIGLLVLCLNGLVGSAVFATLTNQANLLWVKLVTGCISLIAAILAGIQTFRRDSERAEKHRASAAKFTEMLRELELVEVKGINNDPPNKFLEDFNKRYVQLLKEAPVPDEDIYSELYKLHFEHAFSLGSLGKKPERGIED